MRLVLRLPQLHQMIHALFQRFHMAVKHRRVRSQPNLVRRSRDLQPHLPAHFVVADQLAHAGVENLRAAAGQRIHARGLHRHQRVANRKFRDSGVVAHLDHRESLQVDLRKALLQPANQFEVILEWQIGMQSADDVKFRGAFGHSSRRALPDFIERKRVRAAIARRTAKRAQLAMRDAHIGGIDVPVDVVIRHVPVPPFALVVRQPSQRQQVAGLEKRQAVFQRQPLARQHFVRDRFQPRVRNLKFRRYRVQFSAAAQGRMPMAAAPQNNKNNKLI